MINLVQPAIKSDAYYDKSVPIITMGQATRFQYTWLPCTAERTGQTVWLQSHSQDVKQGSITMTRWSVTKWWGRSARRQDRQIPDGDCGVHCPPAKAGKGYSQLALWHGSCFATNHTRQLTYILQTSPFYLYEGRKHKTLGRKCSPWKGLGLWTKSLVSPLPEG